MCILKYIQEVSTDQSKKDCNNPACYHPVSLLDSLVKLVDWIILNWLQGWADSCNLSDRQYGFCPEVGTVAQGLNLNCLIRKCTKIKNIYLAFVDL